MKRIDPELFTDKISTKVITFTMSVTGIEFLVLADVLGVKLQDEAVDVHGCLRAKCFSVKVNGKEVFPEIRKNRPGRKAAWLPRKNASMPTKRKNQDKGGRRI